MTNLLFLFLKKFSLTVSNELILNCILLCIGILMFGVSNEPVSGSDHTDEQIWIYESIRFGLVGMCTVQKKKLDDIHSKNNQRFRGFTEGIQGSSLLDTIQFVCDTKGIINYKVAAFNIWTKETRILGSADSQR